MRRTVTLAICALLLLALGAGVAGAHSGGLDSNGGHHCREAGYNSGKCAPLNSYHCHSAGCVPPGGSQPSSGGGGTASTPAAPPPPADTTPPDVPELGKATATGSTVTVPVVAERGARITVLLDSTVIHSATADGGEQQLSFSVPDGRHALTVVATDAAGNASQPARFSVDVDTTPPEPPELRATTGRTGAPLSSLTVQGEAGADYGLVVAGATKVQEGGRLPASGEAILELELRNGEHQITVHLVDAAGNRSGETVIALTVAVPPPTAPGVAQVSEPGASPLVLAVSGDPLGEVTVTLSGEAATAEQPVSLDVDGESEVAFDVPDGHYDVSAIAEDFQGQRSSAAELNALVVDTTPPALSFVFDDELLRQGQFAFALETEPGARVRIDSDTQALRGEFVADQDPYEFVVELASGAHTVLVTAIDEFGNETVQEFTAEVVAAGGFFITLIALAILFSPVGLLVWQRRRIAGLVGTVRSKIVPTKAD